jgi:molybdopterin/thiamine biosynthesis adenylyltransferase
VARIAVIGAGNIGSHLLPHVARMRGVDAITVIDRDRYEQTNLGTQNIFRFDLGRSKAQVQAGRLTLMSCDLDVRAVHMPVEDVPLGLRGCLRVPRFGARG